jgi:methionyl-tRNA formyltransferase
VGRFKAVKQPTEGMTYAHKIEKAEAAIDWTLSAQLLSQRIRAFDPFPGMTAHMAGELVKVWQAHAQEPAPSQAVAAASAPAPGTLLALSEDGLQVACGDGVLWLTQLQKPGGKRQAVAEFVRHFKGTAGDVFQS